MTATLDALTAAPRAARRPTRQLTTFWLADHLYGVEVGHVQEVLRAQDLTRVPRAHPAVAGLLNLRGQVVTAVQLRERLGLPPRAPGEKAILVVVRLDGEVVSLLVDAIGDVVDVAEDTFEMPPETLDGAVRDLIRGAYKLDGHLLLALDVARAVDV